MLESITSVISRVEEIKSRFRSARAGGEVTIAPHTAASEPAAVNASSSQSVQPFFPTYLIKKAQSCDEQSTGDGGSAYSEIIESAASKYDVDPALIKGLIRAESGFNTNAVSSTAAQGLMQLMPSTARALGCGNTFDPQQNVDAGTKYLKQQIDRFGSIEKALAAYNAGPGSVIKHNGVPPYRETQNYINKVLSYRDIYESQ